jgi:DNA helicase-2/ATP-dependent DNA helicase PcrA
LGQHIAVHSGILRDLYADKSPEGVSRHENIQELLNGLKEFSESEIELVQDETEIENQLEREENEKAKIENKKLIDELLFTEEESNTPEIEIPKSELSLDIFMQDIALMTDTDKKKETEEDKNKVVLMTIHSAKGLEFPYVYIVGMEENLFPSQMSLTERADLEEERRLFYVALTRAEKRVTLSYSTTRYKWGNLIYCEPSRFIEELDAKYLEMPAENHGRIFGDEEHISKPKLHTGKSKETFVQRPVMGKKLVKINAASKNTTDFDTESLRDLQVGMDVQHDRFGSGKVLTMDGDFPNNKATIFFEGIGQKQLLIKFAKLRIVG